ncbi:MAG: UDP-3-O-(3-hydroxymyristoyl)glucosamine N-acyltransferase [Burkholderiaceae bacterium]
MTTSTARIALHELVALFGGACGGDAGRYVVGFASLADATSEQLAFVTAPRYRAAVATSKASAVLVTENDAALLAPVADRLWVCRDPYLLFARIAQHFETLNRPPRKAGTDATAVVAGDSRVDPSATIGPLSVIGARASIHAGVVIGAGSQVGDDSSIGEGTLIHPGVVIYSGCTIGKRCIVHAGAVIGADGFGFAKDGAQWVRIPQVGGVVLGDDVEIGANTTIDRGALDDTRIGNGVKLDNQIQIGHNVTVGDHTIMAAFVGVAGSATIGKRCQIGGAARIMGHITIADDIVVSTQTFVSRSISKPGQYTGYYPMAEHAAFEKSAAVLKRLDGLRERVRRLEADARATTGAATGNTTDEAARDTSEPERPA